MASNVNQHFDRLFRSADWRLRLLNGEELPKSKLDQFLDKRKSERMSDRRRALMKAELSDTGRMGGLFGIVTRDFSLEGCGFYSPIQLDKDELVKLLLPDSWFELQVVRCIKRGLDCYESGGVVTKWVEGDGLDDVRGPSHLRQPVA